MNKWLSITFKTLIFGVTFLIIIWVGGSVYISKNKEKILSQIINQINNNINGSIAVKSMEPNLFRGFPSVSITLNEVVLRDSLWKIHHHDLIHAKKIHLTLNLFSFITGKANLNRILIRDAEINVFTDSLGYSNLNTFDNEKNKKTTNSNKNKDFEIKKIDFKNVHFKLKNLAKRKNFDFNIQKLFGNIKYPLSGFKGKIELNTMVNSFSFNTNKGSFLKNKNLNGVIEFEYNKLSKKIEVQPNLLAIGNNKFNIGAIINIKKGGFNIGIKSKSVLFREIANLLSPNISKKLAKFNIDKPISVNGNIIDDGSGKNNDPLIKVSIETQNSTVIFPSGELESTNFIGKFTNQQNRNLPIGDANSVIEFNKLSANYFNIPIAIDTFLIKNLEQPIAIGRVKSSFPIERLNKGVDSKTLDFKKGEVSFSLFCKADIDNFKFIKPEINGKIELKNVHLIHIPTKTKIINPALILTFNNKDLFFSNSKLQLGKSQVSLDLNIKNFLNFYYTDPENILVSAQLNSSQLQLNELLPVLNPRNKKSFKKSTPQQNHFINQLMDVLEHSKIQLNINVNRATYKKFIANNLKANISMVGTAVYLNNVSVGHAGGSIILNGDLKNTGKNNRFNIKTQIKNVNIKEFFHAFENFGQSSITEKNIKGFLSAQTQIFGLITNNGILLPKSLSGNVNFNLRNAALINFEPMIKAGKFAFANRDFSNIRMKKLDGSLNINGDKIKINPMEISSSVINMNVEGTYGLKNGTDLFLEIPLRNPEKDLGLSEKEKKEQRLKGLVIKLRAIDNDNGGVKFKLARNNKDKNN